ncbi:MAG: chromosome segregation protein SMC [Chthoniobacterales bacterium]
MYLQSLEMIGFKSFAPKTVLNFNEGVTAVVGPNGCGKSNVLDALRWVLGEQSAKALRGGEMADVIFSGTDSRQALGMAEVSLTFTDCEKELGVQWNEVRITRRVFRDGKSEYLLNKSPCRLRDIHQLFMDTGIGRSAYSIMEQGKIDAILSSRPEDRRAIFEEAAGITKYKAQKKEALRKLDYTEANLLRVTDIIKEVKRQIGSLQRQAAKARRYQSVMEDLRVFDTHLSFRNFNNLQTELKDVREKLGGSEETRQRLEGEIETRELELAQLRDRLGELEAQATGLRDNVQSQRNKIYSAENRIATNGERAVEARNLIERYRAEIESGEEKLRDQESQIARTDEMIADTLDLMRTGEEKLDGANARLVAARDERVDAERGGNTLRSEIGGLESRLNALRGEIASAGGRREAGEARLGQLESEAAAAGEATNEAGAAVAKAADRRGAAEEALGSAKAELGEAQAAQDEVQRERQSAESELNVANRRVAEVDSKLGVLRQLAESGEGFGEGTQAVLRGLDNPEFFKPAVLGALASLIDVPSEHIPAVEAALGANLQAIVFKDPSVAEAAVQTLFAKSLGKAAVIPRDWIADRSGEPGALPEGASAWAVDLVKAEGDVAGLIQRLLGGVAVVATVEQAFALKPDHPQLAFVTRGGEFVSVEGIVQGGRGGDKGSSALARKNEIAALDRELAGLRETAGECAGRRDEASAALESAQERVRMGRDEVQAAQVEFSTAQSECAMCERQQRDAENRRVNYDREVTQTAEAVAKAAEKVSTLESQIGEVEGLVGEARTRQTDAESGIEVARDKERSMADELSELRLRVATERQQQESLTRQRGPMAARVAELSELLASRGRDIEDADRKIHAFDGESEEMRGSIVTWQALLESGEQQVEGLMADRNAMQEECETVEQRLRDARRGLTDMQDSRGKLEVRGTQLEMRTEHVREHVTQRYQVDLEGFRTDSYALMKALGERTKGEGAPLSEEGETGDVEVPPNTQPSTLNGDHESEEGVPWGRVEELVVELTEKIDRMGPVNIDAIQEFEELEERYTFLEQQNTDLINSKAELLEVISKINRTTKELFAETFEKIRVNFQEMFTELFGGGKANLILTDESDPLESGIEIVAKPPGKQLSSITLLSGGEKTMTAVSLLFSIYMVKPSPFCVLDEMDAPLDESNINRFIKILDRFVGQSQFVVITHNKRTIARADMVFGVTMEEHGVSKLVSVKFADSPNGTNGTAGANGTNGSNGHPRSVAETFGKSGNLHSEEVALAR